IGNEKPRAALLLAVLVVVPRTAAAVPRLAEEELEWVLSVAEGAGEPACGSLDGFRRRDRDHRGHGAVRDVGEGGNRDGRGTRLGDGSLALGLSPRSHIDRTGDDHPEDDGARDQDGEGEGLLGRLLHGERHSSSRLVRDQQLNAPRYFRIPAAEAISRSR